MFRRWYCRNLYFLLFCKCALHPPIPVCAVLSGLRWLWYDVTCVIFQYLLLKTCEHWDQKVDRIVCGNTRARWRMYSVTVRHVNPMVHVVQACSARGMATLPPPPPPTRNYTTALTFLYCDTTTQLAFVLCKWPAICESVPSGIPSFLRKWGTKSEKARKNLGRAAFICQQGKGWKSWQ